MTLRFSSFSIKDILTGRDAWGQPGARSTEEPCAPKRNICSGHGGARVPNLSHQDADQNCIHSERLPAGLRVSAGIPRSDTCSEEFTREETEHRGGEHFYSGRHQTVKTKFGHLGCICSIWHPDRGEQMHMMEHFAWEQNYFFSPQWHVRLTFLK